MSTIRLTPAGHLRWEPAPEECEVPAALRAVEQGFERDWREGLFRLAASKAETGTEPVPRYWQEWAERYLTALCHIPASAESLEVEPPSEDECAHWAVMAPPMQGGEYLSSETLRTIWEAFGAWVSENAPGPAGLQEFLETHAPKWKQVGRVCFHLAENRNHPDRPFAFMATYTAGLGADGRLKHRSLGKALEEYAGAKNKAALIKLLSPVNEAAERCPWVKEMVNAGTIYRPLAWTPGQAYQFLKDAPELEASGLSIQTPNWWRKRPRPRVSATIGDVKSGFGTDAMLDFDARVMLGDEELSEADIKALLEGEDGLVMVKGQWVEVDREKLQQALTHLESLRQEAGADGIDFVRGMRLLAGAAEDLSSEAEFEEERPWLDVSAGGALRETLEALRDPRRLEPAEVDGMLRATLRPYQKEGVAWLRLLTGLGLGACLADDMGLGKTLQMLALLLADRQEQPKTGRKPSLLVVPASLMSNWRAEAERFAPDLSLLFLHPASTSKDALAKIAEDPRRRLEGTDLAITTYAMLTRQTWLADVQWRFVILDEAQAIKNPSTRQTKAVKKLQADGRAALTGTPLENRLGDLWSLFDFLNPGLLSSAKAFQNFVKALESRSKEQFAPLRKLVGPYILRRLKTDRSIIDDLPEKTEATAYCHLTKAQVKLYQNAVQNLEKSLETADNIARRGLVLQTIMRLKQICNHPSQLTGDPDYSVDKSGKLIRLAEICEELAERQEKVLVFTQFREIAAPLAECLTGVFKRPGLVLHGGTAVKTRRSLVEQFQDEDGPPFFILSLKAGGTGLNLTAASHVIHFDRWWNPAVENQATDRAFRIGQKRNVMVHKFVSSGTIEERIDALISEKQQLAEEILSTSGEVPLTELPDDELLDLVRLDISRAAV